MAKITIRDLPYQEAAPHINWLTSYAFTSTPPVGDQQETLEVLEQTDATTRHLVVFEDEEAVACAGAGEMTQNVRGKIMPMSGIFACSNKSTARTASIKARSCGVEIINAPIGL